MIEINSKEVSVNCPIDECFDFVSDMNNYELLLPKDKISNWESSKNQCSFKILNIYTLEMIFDHAKENELIHIKSGPISPFKFELDLNLKSIQNTTSAQLKCNADINPMLKLMIQKPLNNLFDYMAEKLAKIKS